MEHDDGSSLRTQGRVRTGVWVGVVGLLAWLLALPAVYPAGASTDPPLRGGVPPQEARPLGSVMDEARSTSWETAYHSALGVDPRVELVPGQTYPFVHTAHGVIDQTTGVTISVIDTESSFLGLALYYGTMSGSQAGEPTLCPLNYPVFFSGSFRGQPPQGQHYSISKCTIPPHPSGTRVWYRIYNVRDGVTYRYLQAVDSFGCDERTPLGQCIHESFFFPRVGVGNHFYDVGYASPTPTETPTPTTTPTETSTPTNTPTNTPTETPTPTNTPTETSTPTNTPTNTPTETSTPTNTPTNTPTATIVLPPRYTMFLPWAQK